MSNLVVVFFLSKCLFHVLYKNSKCILAPPMADVCCCSCRACPGRRAAALPDRRNLRGANTTLRLGAGVRPSVGGGLHSGAARRQAILGCGDPIAVLEHAMLSIFTASSGDLCLAIDKVRGNLLPTRLGG